MPFDGDEVLQKFREFEAVLMEGDQSPRAYRGPFVITQVFPRPPQDPGYTEKVLHSLRMLLSLADVTDGLRQYVEDNVMVAYRMGLPPDRTLAPVGIDPEKKGDYGFFNPQNAEAIERSMHLAAKGAETLPERVALVREWERQIERKYPRK